MIQSSPKKQCRAEAGAAIAAIALWMAGSCFYSGLPMILGAITQTRGFSVQQIGWIGTLSLAGMLVGSTITPLAITSRSFRVVGAISLAIILGGMSSAILATEFSSYCQLSALIGFGGGVACSVAASRTAVTQTPVRNFGFLNAAAVVAAAAQNFVTPRFTNEFGLVGTFLFPTLMVAGAALFVPALVVRGSLRDVLAETATGKNTLPVGTIGWLTLATMAIGQMAPAGFWTYSEQLGHAAHLSENVVGATLTAGFLLSGLSGLLANPIGRAFGTHRAQLAVMLFLAFVVGTCVLPIGGAVGFIARSVAFSSGWNFLIIYQFATATKLDHTGRLAGLVPAAQNVGATIGPAAGVAILNHGYDVAGMLAWLSLFLVLGLLMSIVVHWRSERLAIDGGRGE